MDRARLYGAVSAASCRNCQACLPPQVLLQAIGGDPQPNVSIQHWAGDLKCGGDPREGVFSLRGGFSRKLGANLCDAGITVLREVHYSEIGRTVESILVLPPRLKRKSHRPPPSASVLVRISPHPSASPEAWSSAQI